MQRRTEPPPNPITVRKPRDTDQKLLPYSVTPAKAGVQRSNHLK